MKKINNYYRASKIIDETICKLNLNLKNMTILTEAASGNFVVTPIIALKAGAEKVYVVCRDSRYGKKEEVLEYLRQFTEIIGLDSSKVIFVNDKNEIADKVNIVTNSGFVRPITREFIEKLPSDAAIPLMFESWEFRAGDIDIEACKERNIPVLGTNEMVPELRIFKYVAMSVLKLLMERDIEVFRSRVLLISSGGYLKETKELLLNNGVDVLVYDVSNPGISKQEIEQYIGSCDAVIVAEQACEDILLGERGARIDVKCLEKTKPVIIHIAGVIDYETLDKYKLVKYPENRIGYGYMTVTTDYVGVRPVVELNAGGLKVGQALVEGMRRYNNCYEAMDYALEHSPAMDFELFRKKNVGGKGLTWI